jgi:hypothetical protein
MEAAMAEYMNDYELVKRIEHEHHIEFDHFSLRKIKGIDYGKGGFSNR